MNKNKIYLVGAGPGRPDLITVRGLNILREADVVLYDYLIDKRLLDEAKKGAELICCDGLSRLEKINNLMLKKAGEGKKVIRLKNGDPAIFARTSQELDFLVKAKIEFEVVPGITAASAASSFTGVPLTDREISSSVTIVTGKENPNKKRSSHNWEAIAASGTIALYMSVQEIPEIVKKLIKAGKPANTPAIVVSKAGDLNQRITKGQLNNIAKNSKQAGITAPAVFIIGKTVTLEKKFNWCEKNKRVLFTGLSNERFFIKDTYFHLPMIKIEPMEDYKKFDEHLRNISDFDWIVFMSRYTVKYFFMRLREIGSDCRALSKIKIAAIGNSTKSELANFGILADLVPKKESSEGLLKELSKLNLNEKTIFLPRSNIADKGLAKKLKAFGAVPVSGFAYKNIMPDNLPNLDLNFFDEIMFTSPSTVRNFKKRYKRLPKSVKINCIGDITSAEVKKCRL